MRIRTYGVVRGVMQNIRLLDCPLSAVPEFLFSDHLISHSGSLLPALFPSDFRDPLHRYETLRHSLVKSLPQHSLSVSFIM